MNMKYLSILALSTALVAPAIAADMPTKAPAYQVYDLTHCGAYIGLNSIGSATSVQGVAVPGTQLVNAGLGGTIGYGCPFNAQTGSFWFAEGLFDIVNINGTSNGLNLSGPLSFTQRFGAGTPINNMLSVFNPLGGLGTAAVPSLPVLPNGVTASPGAPYIYAALHEQDISAQLGLASNREWLFSYGVGMGLRYRLSNGVVADTFAEYKTQSNLICIGPLGQAGCTKTGPGVQVGFQFLY
jgi:opacity protein-like surface antigen